MNFEAVRDRVMSNLEIGDGADAEEISIAHEWWAGMVTLLDEGGDAPGIMIIALMEEALIWRIVSFRIEKVIGGAVLFSSNRAGAGGVSGPAHPAIEALAKARERLRKVMKELTESLKQDKGQTGLGLPDVMKPILLKGEGVIEDALEFEARKKRAKKARAAKKRTGRVPDTA